MEGDKVTKGGGAMRRKGRAEGPELQNTRARKGWPRDDDGGWRKGETRALTMM